MTNSKKAISVILPVYNAEEFLSDSIESILQQTFEDFELIIINDGSTDRSKDIALSYKDKRVKYIENKNNQGLIKSLNKGLHFAEGKYIARMDADDICHNTRFEKQISYFENNPDVDIVGTGQYIIGSQRIIYHKPTNEENRIRLLLQPVVGHSTVMMKKDILNQNKLYYDKNAIYAEDYKLWVDSSLCGLVIRNIDECLCGYRVHGNQISNQQNATQRFVANRIRISYAKYFFHHIIAGNEIEYLYLIHGIDPSLKLQYAENIEKLYCRLLTENSIHSFFDKELFEEFLKQQIIKIQHC